MNSIMSILGLIIGAILILLGGYIVAKGKIPFLKGRSGEEDTPAYSRIKGVSTLLAGILLIFFIVFQWSIIRFLVGIVVLDVLTLLAKARLNKK